ncbi:carboxymuconolactone decarboxylase family protein [Denitrobaculum tricleocarpae]|uniref:carboxymuconolactone decarboxylase family protein n=1 Tax=Denitrobaculum tricleocarpae TaxID=2591009 RepID=UPI0015D13F9B|nr:peroxidase-related enzyme [Denitrobaculum tricleocarpae]
MGHLSYTKNLPGVADVFLRDPGLYAPLLQFIEGVMTRPSQLGKAEREMIAAHVSRRNGCGFCVGAHHWTLVAMGVDAETMDALDALAAGDGEGLSSGLRALLRFADRLTERPDEIGQEDVNALMAVGWSEQAVEDAVNVVALFNYVNRLVDALGIEAGEPYFRQIGKVIATDGYAPLIETALKRAG